MHYSLYYQAHIVPSQCWYVTAVLRSYEHVCFDRTLDTQTSLFEFFVPEATEPIFLYVIEQFVAKGLVINLQKLPNRLAAKN